MDVYETTDVHIQKLGGYTESMNEYPKSRSRFVCWNEVHMKTQRTNDNPKRMRLLVPACTAALAQKDSPDGPEDMILAQDPTQ